jgi:hypothetical protein
LFRAAALVGSAAAGAALAPARFAHADTDLPRVAGFHLFNLYSGRVLEVRGSSTANDGPVVIWLNNGTLTQQWALTAANGFITLTNRNSGKVLEVPRSSVAEGTQLVQYDSNGTAAQQWQLKNVGDGYQMLINRNSGKVAGITTSVDGTAVVQQTPNGTDRQLWQFVPA